MNKQVQTHLQERFDRDWIRERNELQHFWKRIPKPPIFKEMNILDFGSGLGCLTLELAARGASKVTGIEIEEEFSKYAEYNLHKNHEKYKNIIHYTTDPLETLPDCSFDVIISKDVFEHVSNLPKLFPVLINKLKPYGTMLLGFGPLWYSPFGDHGIAKKIVNFSFPWGHLILGNNRIISHVNNERKSNGLATITSLQEAGMNGMKASEYEDLIYNSGLKVDYYTVNKSNNLLGKVLGSNLIGVHKILGKYLIRTIYCRLIKE